MTKRRWVLFHAIVIVVLSLIAAACTHNPNWPLNIPLGLIVGSIYGFATWTLVRWAMGADREGR